MPVNWGMDSYVYTKGLSSLEFSLALVTFDARGVGRSDAPRSHEEFSLATTACDGASVADAVGLSRSVVLGHSSGGAVGLTYALAFPERVSHIILMSTAPRWTVPGPFRMDGRVPVTEDEMREQVRESIAREVRNPVRFAHAMDEILPKMRFSPPRLQWVVETGARGYDVRERLPEIRIPTLILHGREDRIAPLSDAERLHAGIRNSRLRVLDECGHWPHVEKRAEFVAAVKEFLGLEDRPNHSF